MKNEAKRLLTRGIILIAGFAVWTVSVITVGVQPAGVNGTDIGFAEFNCLIHQLTGVHMKLYTVTDWLGLVPLAVCVMFAVLGFIQLVQRRSIMKVDRDILLLGIYYAVVIVCYLAFEMIPINYRPVLINGVMEVSYPSSTTLLVLSVMPTLVFQLKRRLNNTSVIKATVVTVNSFTVFMVIGRLYSGVHWATDIIGSALLSTGLFLIYKSFEMLCSGR